MEVPAQRVSLAARVASVLLFCQLLMIAGGAFHFAPWLHVPWLGDALVTLGDLTGSRYSFGFFAPDIPNPVVAEVTTVHYDGAENVRTFGGGTTELDHRIQTMMAFFTVVDTDNLHAASLAAYAFGRDDSVEKVKVSLRCYVLPTMAQYRAGQKPDVREYYAGLYARRRDQ
jgi:hypothetical protein